MLNHLTRWSQAPRRSSCRLQIKEVERVEAAREAEEAARLEAARAQCRQILRGLPERCLDAPTAEINTRAPELLSDHPVIELEIDDLVGYEIKRRAEVRAREAAARERARIEAEEAAARQAHRMPAPRRTSASDPTRAEASSSISVDTPLRHFNDDSRVALRRHSGSAMRSPQPMRGVSSASSSAICTASRRVPTPCTYALVTHRPARVLRGGLLALKLG